VVYGWQEGVSEGKHSTSTASREDARIFEDCIGIVDGTLILFGTSPGFPTGNQNADLFSYKKRRYGTQVNNVITLSQRSEPMS